MGDIIYDREIIITEDGSCTLFVPEINEHYHSIHGAIQESNHIFIDYGFNYFKNKKSLSILDIGLGTGLNAFLTYLNAKNNNVSVNYVAIEKYPITTVELDKLNYSKDHTIIIQNIFKDIHNSNWSSSYYIDIFFKIRKVKTDLLDYLFKEKFDLIYFDAFSPNIQPKLWALEVFSNLFDTLNIGGVLVTYSAKGQVRRDMQSAGFNVERLPGPPGKREMLRGVKL